MHRERLRDQKDSDFEGHTKIMPKTKDFDIQFLGWFKNKASPHDRSGASVLDRLSRNRVDRLAFDRSSEP
jgi:hypothetical protein